MEDRNEICTDFYQIISGSSNTASRAYTEAVVATDSTENAIGYLKNFIASIENIASKNNAVDKRICDSKGNIRDFVGYDNIEKSMKFLSTNRTPGGASIVGDLKTLYDMAEKYKTYYVNGYKDNNRLLMHEYECLVYLLVTGLSMTLSFCFDATDASGTTKVVPKPRAYFGVTGKKIHEMAEELSKKNHATYLEQMEKATGEKSTTMGESAMYTESVASAITTTVSVVSSVWGALKATGKFAINAARTVKNTVFGIVPLIRGVIYLSYKRKADTILALDQNVVFLERNIEILTNKNMDPAKKEKIINKQKAQIEAYKKRAEKLRAQLEEGEKDASTAVKAENGRMNIPAGNDSGDFVLESVLSKDLDSSLYAEIMESSRPMTHKQIIAKRKSCDLAHGIVGADKKPLEFFGWFHKKKPDGKKPDEQQNVDPGKTIDKNTLDEIFKEFSSKYARESVRLSLKKVDKDLPVTASKIGGHGFWPTGKRYPDDLALLIQVNFEEIPNIKDFPTKGILQVFINDEDVFSGKVFYHDSTTSPMDVANKPTLEESSHGPIDSIYALTGTKVSQCPCCWYDSSDEFDELFVPILNEYLHTSFKTWSEIANVLSGETIDMLYDKYITNVESWGTRVGGYPNFTQFDRRSGKGDERERLVIQIDSEEGIMFGDCGIANVFMSYEDLKAKRFEKATFDWDCY